MQTKVNLIALHDKSRLNRSFLSESKIYGCFYCFSEFPFDQISDWVVNARTALCPYCGIDAVLGFEAKQVDQELLHRVHERWFKRGVLLTPEEWQTAVETNVWPGRLSKPSRRK